MPCAHEGKTEPDWMLVGATALMVALYLTANLMAVKLLCVHGTTWFDCGTLLFPLVYMLGDVTTEVWGYRVTRRLIWLTFGCNLMMILGTALACLLPSPDFQTGISLAYRQVYAYVPRIVAASLVAYVTGGLANAWSMEKIRKWTDGRWLWVRTIGSSIYGYIFDTGLFVLLAFGGTTPIRDMVSMLAMQFGINMLMEIFLATPVAYVALHILRVRKNETRPSPLGE